MIVREVLIEFVLHPHQGRGVIGGRSTGKFDAFKNGAEFLALLGIDANRRSIPFGELPPKHGGRFLIAPNRQRFVKLYHSKPLLRVECSSPVIGR